MNPTNPFLKQSPIKGIKNIILIGSGKGGVGKSSLCANIACQLAQKHRVGLLDGDFYGPSLATLFGLKGKKVEMTEDGKLEPLEKFKLKLMSISFLTPEEGALIWRGPMLFKAIDQFLRQVNWGDLDYLLIDLPPGTGDVALSFSQKVPCTGSILISTPQNLSLIDIKKSISMMETLKIPIIGLIENMSYLELKDEKIDLFPKGDLENYLKEKKIDLLESLPMDPYFAKVSDSGLPLLISDHSHKMNEFFEKIAQKIREFSSKLEN